MPPAGYANASCSLAGRVFKRAIASSEQLSHRSGYLIYKILFNYRILAKSAIAYQQKSEGRSLVFPSSSNQDICSVRSSNLLCCWSVASIEELYSWYAG
ncbi:hypothetical protein [Microseira sp. BLCC-F43]|uniref:hypothetical protein n=1 Tax=Microseira sp. BLCC-F43 TaxID=3153602 RepID=UPI0035B86878